MSKKLILTFLLFPAVVFAVNPIKITWNQLADVTFKKKWNAKENMFLLDAVFGPKVLELKGKEVLLGGYMIPIDVDANYYVLSSVPFASCFFCGGSGPETVATIKFKKVSKRYNTDDKVTVKGILRLNSDDINELTYILENAEVI